MSSSRAAGLLVLVASLVLYGLTLHPSVAGGDSGELMCVAHELATPHPPGYPTFAFTTKAAEIAIRAVFPELSVAYAQNLFSGFLSCVANALLAMTTSTVTGGNTAAGVLAGMLFGFSPNVWTYAVSTEVFPLNNALSAGLLLLVVQFHQRHVVAKLSSVGFVYFAAFCCGLALTNQHTSVLFVAPIALWVFAMDPSVVMKPLRLLLTSCCFFLGLSPYIYLPLSSTFVLSTNSWGKLNTLEHFAAHFLRAEYGTFSLASKESTYKVSNYSRTTKLYFLDIYDQLGVSTLLACVGLMVSLAMAGQSMVRGSSFFQKKLTTSSSSPTTGKAAGVTKKIPPAGMKNMTSSSAPKSGGKSTSPVVQSTTATIATTEMSPLRFNVFTPPVIFLITWTAYINFFNYLSNLPIDQPLFYGVQQRFWIQPLLIVVIFLGIGFDACLKKLLKLPEAAVFAIALALVTVQVSLHFAQQDESENYHVRDFGRNILRVLPQNAILLTKGDLMINSARFVQCTEGYRPDVKIIDQELMTFAWYNKAVKAKYPEIKLPGSFYFPGRSDTYDMKAFLDKNRNPSKQRVFLAVGWKEGDPSLQGHYNSIPFGLASEAVTSREREALLGRADSSKRMSKLEFSTRTKYAKELSQAYPNGTYVGSLPPVGRYPAHSWEAVVLSDTHHSAINIAFQLLNLGEQGPPSSGGDLVAEKKTTFYKMLVAAKNLFTFTLSDSFDQSKTPSYVTRNLGVVNQKLVDYSPNDRELIAETKEAFEAHLVALTREAAEEDVKGGGSYSAHYKAAAEGRRSIEEAVKFYVTRLAELDQSRNIQGV